MFADWAFTSSKTRPRKPEGAFDHETTAGNPSRSGLVSNARVATVRGWQRVGDLQAGDMVLTFDAGLQQVTKVTREILSDDISPCARSHWPIEVPIGALGNREPLQLLPNQSIMVESDAAEDMFGDPFTLIPAEALTGLRGVDAVPPRNSVEIVQIHFAEEQVVFGEQGTLFLCPSSRDVIDLVFEAARDPLYSILPIQQARIVALSLPETMPQQQMNAPINEMQTAFA